MAEAQIKINLANGAEAGTTLQSLTKEANKLNKEISKLPVGSQEFIEKSKQLQDVSKEIGDVKSEIKGTTEASDELKQSFLDFVPFGDKIRGIGGEFAKTTQGVGGLIGKMGVLKTAIAATGIGALLLALSSLYEYLTSTQDGMDKVSKITRSVSAVFEKLKGVVQELGGKVFKQLSQAIENPKQAFIDLGKILLDNIINRFKAFALIGPALKKIFSGDISEGLKDMGNAALQAATGVEKVIDKIGNAAKSVKEFVNAAVNDGLRLDELQKQIERAEINQIKRSKQLELIIKQQKDIVEDVTKSWNERRAAAEKALDAQGQQLNLELSLLDKRIEKMKLEQSLNDTSRENEKELAELIAKRLEIEGTITEQRIEFKNKIREFDIAQAAEELSIQKNTENLRIEVMRDGFEKELKQIESQTQEKIRALMGTEQQITEQRLLLEEIQLHQIQALREKYEAQEKEKEKARYAQQQADLDLALATEQNLINEQLLAREITTDEFTQLTSEKLLAYQAQKLEIIRAANGEESLEYQRAYAEYLGIQQAAADSSVKITEDLEARQEAALQGALSTFGNVFGSLAGLYGQGTKQYKAFATAQASIAAIQGAISAYSSTAAIPVVGPVLAPIASGVALAAGIANVAKIRKTELKSPVQKARRGMVLRGPSHEQGGIPIEAEGDEIILTKGVYRNPILRKAASIINEAAGGVKFASGGVPTVSSSVAARTADQAVASSTSMADLQALVDAIDRRIDRIKVQNVVTETQDAIKVINTIVEDANV